MLRKVPCTLVLSDGTRISCQRITKISTTMYGTATIGQLEVLTAEGERNVFLHDIAQIE